MKVTNECFMLTRIFSLAVAVSWWARGGGGVMYSYVEGKNMAVFIALHWSVCRWLIDPHPHNMTVFQVSLLHTQFAHLLSMFNQKELEDRGFNYVIMWDTMRCESIGFFLINLKSYLNQEHTSSEDREMFVIQIQGMRLPYVILMWWKEQQKQLWTNEKCGCVTITISMPVVWNACSKKRNL